jgi:signal transduction histidine kinase
VRKTASVDEPAVRAPSEDERPDAGRERELLTLLDISKAISSTLELDALLELILDQLKVVADYAGASIGTISDGLYEIVASRGPDRQTQPDSVVGLRLPVLEAGVIRETLSRKEAVIIVDVRDDSVPAREFRAALGDHFALPPYSHIRSSLLAPLVAHDQVIGLISLSTREPGYYTARHARLVEAIAGQAALAIENARLYAQAREEARRTRTLAETAFSVTLAGSLDRVLTDLAERVVQTGRAKACAVFVTEEELTEGRMAGMYGLPPEYARRLEALMQAGKLTFTLADLEEHRPIVRRNVWQTFLARPEMAPLHPFGNQVEWDMAVLLPLSTRGRKEGVLATYYHHDQEPDAAELAFLGAIGNQAAIAVENARLFAEAQEKASLEERSRIARDLHDSATQTVFSMGMLAQAAQRQYERGSKQLGETLDRLAELAQQAHAELRSLLFELRPDEAIEQGLEQGLARLVAAVQTRTGLAVELTGDIPETLPPEQAMALFRILQEALNNVVKHARASKATVHGAEEPEGFHLTVTDDGAGFDAAAAATEPPRGLGMRSMRERAAAAGIGLTVTSSPGAGTTVELLVPAAQG